MRFAEHFLFKLISVKVVATMKDRKPKVRSEPALRRSSTTPDSANGDKECILDGDRTSIAALIFCLISAACMGWWLMAHAQRALDPSICGGELFAAKPPHFMNGTAAFLDGQKRLASQVGHGTVGRNGRLGTGTNCVSLDGEVRHPHALSLLPSSNRRPSYVIFDLMNTAVTEENGLRKIKTKHALRGRSSDRVYGAPTWEWLRFGFGINKGLPTYRKWGIGEGVEFSVIDATNSAILWQSAPEFINDSYMGNACVNISNVQFIMLKVTASKAAAGAHAVFEDPLLFSGHIPTATCRSRPPFMDSLM